MDQRDVAAALRAEGHRVTSARQIVWDVLTEVGDHLTVDELAEHLRERNAGVNLASVYRALALFEDLGLVRQSRLADDTAATWELAHPDEHFHVICTACGEVDHHAGTLVQAITEHLGAAHGFTVEQVELRVTGRCAACAARG